MTNYENYINSKKTSLLGVKRKNYKYFLTFCLQLKTIYYLCGKKQNKMKVMRHSHHLQHHLPLTLRQG